MAPLFVLALFCAQVLGQEYFLGKQGANCFDTCLAQGLNCNPNIQTNNSLSLFQSLGVNCKADTRNWWAEDQPSYVVDPSDPNYGDCLGYTNVPQNVMCGGNYAAVQRLCRCEPLRAASDVSAFGIGLSAGGIGPVEFQIFGWAVPSGVTGVMTHFWITGSNPAMGSTTIRYYVDGETTASIAYNPGLASGVGFNDAQAPWGTKWIGKGAADGSWWNNIRIPFQKSIRVTWQATASYGGMYVILRGAPNLPIEIGGVAVPKTAHLKLLVTAKSLQPLEYVDLVSLPAGTSGLHFFSTLAVSSGNLNFLEGCYRTYSPPTQAYPGTLLSTGTEDYFDSGWYFNAGEFHQEVSGYTHYATGGGGLTWSAYRFHEMDPLTFNNGFKFTWRNGDAVDPATGLKCFIQTGGNTVGSPTVSNITSYAWVYTW
jgi:hypothetical protein